MEVWGEIKQVLFQSGANARSGAPGARVNFASGSSPTFQSGANARSGAQSTPAAAAEEEFHSGANARSGAQEIELVDQIYAEWFQSGANARSGARPGQV